jgi:hypothetical protein
MEMTLEQERVLRVQSFMNRLKGALDSTNYQPNKGSLEDQRYDVSENVAYLKREMETMTLDERADTEELIRQAEEFLK